MQSILQAPKRPSAIWYCAIPCVLPDILHVGGNSFDSHHEECVLHDARIEHSRAGILRSHVQQIDENMDGRNDQISCRLFQVRKRLAEANHGNRPKITKRK